MICEICRRKGARVRRVTRSYGQGEELYLIENVPAISCPRCGEGYLTAETLHQLEHIKLHRQNLATERPVPVATFS